MNNIIKKFEKMFNKKSIGQPLNGATNPIPDEETSMENFNEIPESLFVDKEPPIMEEKKEVKVAGNKLSAFLGVDYKGIGYSDGYRYHSAEVLDNYKRLVRSEFRAAVDFVIDEIKSKKLITQRDLIDSKALSQKLAEKYEQTIVRFEEEIIRLEQEKDWSSVDEGLVMGPINQYRDGFIRGMEDYAEESMLMCTNGIFK